MFRRSALTALILMLLSTSSASAATATIKMVNYGFKPKVQTVTLGNSVKWKNASTKRHTATPKVSWSWGGVTVAPGSTSNTVTPTQAGTFPYFCSMHPTTMKGTIKVPMTVSPLAGNTETFFTLTLGTEKAPGVLVHQIEVRQNGGAWQLRATTAEPTIAIFFPTSGTWDIHTRLRYQLGGATSGWSPVVSVQVF
jgi:plastocyanin